VKEKGERAHTKGKFKINGGKINAKGTEFKGKKCTRSKSWHVSRRRKIMIQEVRGTWTDK
jgi:ribosomal protein S3AE